VHRIILITIALFSIQRFGCMHRAFVFVLRNVLSSRFCFVLASADTVSIVTQSHTTGVLAQCFTAYLRDTSATSIETASPCKNKQVYEQRRHTN
jgi:hypothetical protein